MVDSFDNFLFAGCSHTFGSEIFYPESLGDRNVEMNAAFGAELSKRLNKNYYNISQPGVGNQYIARSLLFWLLNNKDKIKDTFVIIHWTGENRIDFSYERVDNEPMIKASKYYNAYDTEQVCVLPDSWNGQFPSRCGRAMKLLQKAMLLDLDTRVWQQVDKFATVLMMQELLKSMEVQYLFFNSYDCLENVDRYKVYTEQIDTTKFIDPYEIGGGFYERVINAGYTSNARFNHHQKAGHDWYANWLLENFFT